MIRTALSFLFFCLLAVARPLPAAPLLPGDFASGSTLPGADGNGIHAVELPLSVYEKVLRADLGDLRIFNGAGEMVPHAIRRVAEERTPSRQPVPFFPLPDEHQPRTADLSLRVTRHHDGTVLTVDAGTMTAPHAIGAYLLDTTKLEARPIELELLWGNPSGLLTVSLAQSTDLVHWSPLVQRAVLADLDYQGGRVVVRRIPLPGKPQPYIRLDCIDCREPLLLQEAHALAGPPVTFDQWQWLRVPASSRKEGKDAREESIIDYHLKARLAVTALQLRFPAANSLLRATVEARTDDSAPWRQIARSDFYRLDHDGNTLVNPPVSCPPISAGDWRVRVVADHAGLAGNTPLPELELGWRRQEVLFLGRGAGPYTLAFGSAKAAEVAPLPDTLVLTTLRDTKAEGHLRRIEPGPPVPLGGDQALQPGLPAVPWQKILLWAVLVAGVVLLALMTRTILREMKAKTN